MVASRAKGAALGVSGSRQHLVLSRRAFLKAAAAAGGAAALPLTPLGRQILERAGLASATSGAAGPVPLSGGPYFLSRSFLDPATGTVHDLFATAAALCDRILPTTTDPLTGQVSPGASAAAAVNYIDLFMAAFQADLLGSGLVSTNPLWLRGRFSGRYGYGDPTPGAPLESPIPAPDDFETNPSPGPSTTGTSGIQFLDLTDAQAASWYLRIYGPPSAPAGSAPPYPSWSSTAWQKAVASGLIPGAQPLRTMYQQGLVAFDQWSQQNFRQPYASASQAEQDILLALAGNPVLGAASSAGLPGLPAPLVNPVPPPAAAGLFGPLVLHTIQGTYGLPEYRGQTDMAIDGTGVEPTSGTVWADIGWDGDTQPLGSSVYRYDPSGALDPGYSAETSYTDATGARQPQGGYEQVRPVATPDDGDGLVAGADEIAQLFAALEKAGLLEITGGGAR
jgi:hypothetical protein